MKSFTDLGIRESLVNKLAEKQIIQPTKVQNQVIGSIRKGKNLIFKSETGTGKTFAYLLPVLSRILNERQEQTEQKILPTPQPRLLVIAPTHELASQIKAETDFLCEADRQNTQIAIKAALCIGGANITRQIEMLKEKPQIICGGPARILELVRLKKLKTQHICGIILDEVDRLLSPELRDDTIELIESLPEDAQVIACSATIKPNIVKVLQSQRTDFVQELMPAENVLQEKIEHWAFHAEKRNKIETLTKIINYTQPVKALVFSAETGQIENIVSKLKYKNINCEGIYSKTEKMDRKKIIDDFKKGKIQILVTSDLAARGLDISDVTHIIQMDVPKNEDFFVHRSGRTARAGKNGINIVMGDEWELRNLSNLEKKLKIIIYPKVLYKGQIVNPKDLEEYEG